MVTRDVWGANGSNSVDNFQMGRGVAMTVRNLFNLLRVTRLRSNTFTPDLSGVSSALRH